MNILKICGFIFLTCGIYLLFDHLVLPWWVANQSQQLLVSTTETPVRYQQSTRFEAPVAQLSTDIQKQQNSHCDGRRHCSQMTSCAEAQFFLANCPETQMDGDHDGVPCESQWCHHL